MGGYDAPFEEFDDPNPNGVVSTRGTSSTGNAMSETARDIGRLPPNRESPPRSRDVIVGDMLRALKPLLEEYIRGYDPDLSYIQDIRESIRNLGEP
jgi:hypothetical protein